MDAKTFCDAIGADYFAGVPDSQLSALASFLMQEYGLDPKHHVIAANEGNAVGLVAGYHLATGKAGVVYLQNSGEGNVVNPVASLLSRDVYAIPAIFVVGWRGEPGVPDEPQHAQQGRITLDLLDVLDIPFAEIKKDTTETELAEDMVDFNEYLAKGGSVAFVVHKGALTYEGATYGNGWDIVREDAIARIAKAAGECPIVSTTGKISRELFELREALGQGHGHDFLTVGSMGHASSIALGIAEQKPELRVWCVDGDGAALMHLGAMAVMGATSPNNLVHVVLNNEAHESVGGMPTVASRVSLTGIARECGYALVLEAKTMDGLDEALDKAVSAEGPVFLEVHCAVGSRAELGRPTTTPIENKTAFMESLGV